MSIKRFHDWVSNVLEFCVELLQWSGVMFIHIESSWRKKSSGVVAIKPTIRMHCIHKFVSALVKRVQYHIFDMMVN